MQRNDETDAQNRCDPSARLHARAGHAAGGLRAQVRQDLSGCERKSRQRSYLAPAPELACARPDGGRRCASPRGVHFSATARSFVQERCLCRGVSPTPCAGPAPWIQGRRGACDTAKRSPPGATGGSAARPAHVHRMSTRSARGRLGRVLGYRIPTPRPASSLGATRATLLSGVWSKDQCTIRLGRAFPGSVALPKPRAAGPLFLSVVQRTVVRLPRACGRWGPTIAPVRSCP